MFLTLLGLRLSDASELWEWLHPGPQPQPFSANLFDNDFSYLSRPHGGYVWGEQLKQLQATWPFCTVDTHGTVSTGGELRYRFIDEQNRLRPGGPGDSDYQQWRWRHYVEVRYDSWARLYIEGIDASTFDAELPLTGVDVNRWDLQNAFLDISFGEEQPWTLRTGRQELQYGAQRLISPLDWANTRRNFEGFKLFTRSSEWDWDLWVVQPVNTATLGAGQLFDNDRAFDQRSRDYWFAGSYFTYKQIAGHTFDLFFLYVGQHQPLNGLPYGDRYTLGLRWLGKLPENDRGEQWQAELEGGYQFGNDRSSLYDPASPRASVQAGYVVAGVGHSWNRWFAKPSLWIYYDYATGDQDPYDSQNNTFFQHYGLVHAYLGLIDNLARQNLQDLNVKLQLQPYDPLKLQVLYHWYQLARERDVLYNVAGSPVGTTGRGRDVGCELDLVATFQVNANWSLETGYFWMWYGDYLAAVAPRLSAQMVYFMSTLRY